MAVKRLEIGRKVEQGRRLLQIWNTFIPPAFAVSGLQLARHLGRFKAYENRFIHITRADTVEYVADYSAQPGDLQSTYCECISNCGWGNNPTVKVNVCPAGKLHLSPNTQQQEEQTLEGERFKREEGDGVHQSTHRTRPVRVGHPAPLKEWLEKLQVKKGKHHLWVEIWAGQRSGDQILTFLSS